MEGMRNKAIEAEPSRIQIGIRLLYSLFYLLVFEVLKTVVQLCVLFQYLHLFLVRKANDPVRNFSNRVVAYACEILRYLTLNANLRPFPFADLPQEGEPPVEPVRFD